MQRSWLWHQKIGQQLNRIYMFQVRIEYLWSSVPGHTCEALHQGCRSGAQSQRHLWSWLSPFVTVAPNPPWSSPTSFLTPNSAKMPTSWSPYHALTSHLKPSLQQESALSWGYKNWLLNHGKCRFSLSIRRLACCTLRAHVNSALCS